jgi:hypothetical protein
MRNPFQYALATIGALLALSAASQAQTNPPVFNATQSYKIGDLVTYDSVTFQCLINETTTHPNPHQPPYWGVNYVYAGALLMPVGPSEPLKTITAAWAYIAGARIAENSYIELKLDANYSETFTSSFSLDHPYGSRILFVGTNAGQVASFPNSTTGFTLDSGHTLAALEGLEIFGPPTSGSNGNPAILVTQNACLAKLQNVTLQNFDIGLEATTSGTIDNIGLIKLNQFLIGGAESLSNATINFISPVTFDGSNTTNGFPTYAFSASGGTLNCPGCAGNNCTYNFYATLGGKLEASNSSSSTGTGGPNLYGYYATDHSFIDAKSANNSNNTYGFVCNNGSVIDATYSTSTEDLDFDYWAYQGGIIDAHGNHGGVTQLGTNDGSYIYGF